MEKIRQSLTTLIETCFEIKVFLAVGTFDLRDFKDGDYAEFKVEKINDPKTLSRIVGNHEYRIIADNGFLRVRVYEKCVE